MRKKNQLYEVEIKSKAVLSEGKMGLITYFRGGNRKTIISNVMKLYPQYTDRKEKFNINITPISEEEYQRRVNDNMVYQKGYLQNETVGD